MIVSFICSIAFIFAFVVLKICETKNVSDSAVFWLNFLWKQKKFPNFPISHVPWLSIGDIICSWRQRFPFKSQLEHLSLCLNTYTFIYKHNFFYVLNLFANKSVLCLCSFLKSFHNFISKWLLKKMYGLFCVYILCVDLNVY